MMGSCVQQLSRKGEGVSTTPQPWEDGSATDIAMRGAPVLWMNNHFQKIAQICNLAKKNRAHGAPKSLAGFLSQ